MKKQKKKLTLNRETLRDLASGNAGEVKGGAERTAKCLAGGQYRCHACTAYCGTAYCGATVGIGCHLSPGCW